MLWLPQCHSHSMAFKFCFYYTTTISWHFSTNLKITLIFLLFFIFMYKVSCFVRSFTLFIKFSYKYLSVNDRQMTWKLNKLMPQWFALHGLQWSTLTVSRLLSTKRWWLRFITRYFWNSSKKQTEKKREKRTRKEKTKVQHRSINNFLSKTNSAKYRVTMNFLGNCKCSTLYSNITCHMTRGKKSYEILVADRWWRIDERCMNLHKFTAIYFILFHSHSCIKPSMHRNRFLIRWHIKTQIERWTSVLL